MTLRIDVDGIGEITSQVGQTAKNLGKAQRRALKDVAGEVSGWMRQASTSGPRATAMTARYASHIRGRSSQRYARIAITGRRKTGATIAFFGARPLTRTGWNASKYDGDGRRIGGRRRLPGAKPQFMPWIGNNWIAGKRGEGPYVLNDVLADRMDDVDQMIAKAYRRAIEESLGG